MQLDELRKKLAYDGTRKVMIAGVGAVGSRVAGTLWRLGLPITLYVIDDDTVEPHNIGHQAEYLDVDVGEKKVLTLVERLQLNYENTETMIVPIDSRIPGHEEEWGAWKSAFFDTSADSVLITSLDNASARLSAFFNTSVGTNIVDPRVAGSVIELWALDTRCTQPMLDNFRIRLENALAAENNEAQPCGIGTISHICAIAAGMTVEVVLAALAGEPFLSYQYLDVKEAVIRRGFMIGRDKLPNRTYKPKLREPAVEAP